MLNKLVFSFVASNWRTGWVGALMSDIFSSFGLQDEHIDAMTQANFSGATDPLNMVSGRLYRYSAIE